METLDLVCAIGQDTVDSFIDCENFDDHESLEIFPDLEADEVITSDIEKEMEDIIAGATLASSLHESTSSDVSFFDLKNSKALCSSLTAPQAPVIQTMKDSKIDSQSLDAAMTKLNECMRRTAKSRLLIAKYRSLLRRRTFLEKLRRDSFKSSSPLSLKKCKSLSAGKAAGSPRLAKLTAIDIFTLKPARGPNISGVSTRLPSEARPTSSISEFLRNKKSSNSIWCR